jgi:succinate dehydrogenase / fumarate reductase iron-sulfur subunit
VTPKKAMLGHKLPKSDLEAVKRIYKHVGDEEERYELNLYVVGEEEELDGDAAGQAVHADAAGSHLPAERSPNQ